MGSIREFTQRPGMSRWLTVLVIYKLGDYLATGMIKPFLVDLKLSMAQIGMMLGVVGCAAGLIGAMLGGFGAQVLGRRNALLVRKTEMMRDVVDARGVGRRGLDVGCGQGAYVARMRELGFDVHGIDMSAGQVRLAARNVGGEGIVQVGSVLDIPSADASYDFLYIINVLHHLNSVEEQRRAFRELLRVLKPGGLLFVHEINTRNILFRFYMGYVFPSLNCIDEGVERWLLAHKLDDYTDAPTVDVLSVQSGSDDDTGLAAQTRVPAMLRNWPPCWCGR